MPMVGRGNDARVHLTIVQELWEVAVSFDGAADQGAGLFEPAAMHLGHRGQANVRLGLKVEHVTLANQSVANEPDVHALVGADNPTVSGGGRSEERRVGKECRSRWSPDH